MINTGLVSITFRQLTPKEIVALVKQSGLQGIEWGGDVHVPHGNIKCAGEILKMTEDSGLRVASYGSYYEVGCEEDTNAFGHILETAVALHAPNIRVWAGDKGSKEADEAWWNKVVDESRRIAATAEKAGITVSFEYHGGTLTDSFESAYRLLKDIGSENIRSYWQPLDGIDFKERLHELEQIMPWLSNIHAYSWESRNRLPLADKAEDWRKYLEAAKKAKGDLYCLLEHMKDDSPDQFLRDAETLKLLVSGTAR
jgi:sugar phosphate isomerase/epimerase